MPHVVAQQFLRAHEDRRLDLALGEPLLLRTIGGNEQLGLVRAPASGRVADVKLTYAAGRWVGPHSLLEDDATLAVPDGALVTLRNQTDGSVLALLESLEWTRDATTAAEAAALQEFRDLFGTEALRAGQHLAVRHIALLMSALADATRLYDELGDAGAYGRITRHFEFVKDIVSALDGSVVKTTGDGTVCAFHRLDNAFDAGIRIQRELVRWCEAAEIDPPLEVKLGLHFGPLIAATANDRLDYLGRTANIAAWLRDQARPGELVLLPETLEQLPSSYDDRPGVTFEPFSAQAGARELVRVTIGAPVEGRAA
jgi:adenylate cyclase